MTKKHRISFRIENSVYEGLLVAASVEGGKSPGPYVQDLALAAAERGRNLKNAALRAVRKAGCK